jgi:hypothetical protein
LTTCQVVFHDDGGIDSAAWAQLRGTWVKNGGTTTIGFYGDDGAIPTIDNNKGIKSLTKNKVTTDPFFGDVLSFDYSISDNKLTISNWSRSSDAAEYNGTYTKRQ